MKTVTRDFVEQLIDFAPGEDTALQGIAAEQLEGTVALFNMLQRKRCAYLADEVGMGTDITTVVALTDPGGQDSTSNRFLSLVLVHLSIHLPVMS